MTPPGVLKKNGKVNAKKGSDGCPFYLYTMLHFKVFQILSEKKCAKIWKRINSIAISDIACRKFYSAVDIRILLAANQCPK